MGEYIGFVDSDDWIEPNMFDGLYKSLKDNKCNLVSSDIYVHYDNGQNEIIFDNYDEGLYTDLPKYIYPTMLHDFTCNAKGLRCYLVTKLFKANLLKEIVKKIDASVFYSEDAMILYRYCLACQSIYIMHKPLYHYNKHAGSAETKINKNEPNNMRNLFLNLKQAFEESLYSDILMPQLYQFALILNYRILSGLYGIDLGVKSSWYFPEVENLYDKRLIIYGAGACGQALYKEFWLNGHTEDVVAVVDKNYDKPKKNKILASDFIEGLKYEVKPISAINDVDYDYLVVAIYNKSVAEDAVKELKAHWNVPKDKLICIKSYKKDMASILSLAYL